MTLTARDQAFLAFADGAGGLLHGCALLLVGDARRAERLAETVLARRFPPDGPPEVLLVAALRELVAPRPGFSRPPWVHEPGMELVDSSAARPTASLLDELALLPLDQRACVVLVCYAALEPAVVGAVLDAPAAVVEARTQQAVATLATNRPERLQPGRLGEELRQAVGSAPQLGPGRSSVSDLLHGRQLHRRRRSRRAAALVAAVLLVAVGAVAGLGTEEPVPQAGSTPGPVSAPTPSPVPHVSAACDIHNPTCQATVMREWRAEIARVAASHLDPDGAYFTGYSFSYDRRYETASFWKGEGGALGLELFRLKGGATEVYVQVASDDAFAVRCGQVTRQSCTSVKLMDGNRFSLTSSVDVARGVEVQQSPDGQRVVSLVARNTSGGRELPVTTADLIALVQDPRLQLPEI